ncbi:MAG: hypothetical protein H0X43_10955 [Nitrosospira sp.]|nr:hypothetical protein [Nitrosospira sp.]
MEFISVVLAGVLIFVLGQMILKLFIEPVQQFKKTMAEIAHTSVCYSHAIHNADLMPKELRDEVYHKLRHLSGQLYADMELIPLFPYPVLRLFFQLPQRTQIYKTAQHLIAVGNWMRSSSQHKFDNIVGEMQDACDSLGLYTHPNDRIPDEHLQRFRR